MNTHVNTEMIRAALCDAIAGAIGAAKRPGDDQAQAVRVYGVERYTSDQRRLRAIYGVTGAGGGLILRGWHVRRHAQRVEEIVRGHRYGTTITWRCIGIRALRDTDDEAQHSEILHDADIDRIVVALQSESRLMQRTGGEDAPATPLCPVVSITDGAQLLESGPVMFAGVLCHRAVLEVVTHHIAMRRHET